MLGPLLLMAAGGGMVTLANQGVTDPNGISAGVSFYPDGTYEGLHPTAQIPFGNWLEPPSLAPGGYEIRATLLGGGVASGTLNTWQPLSSTRQWTVGLGGAALLLIEIGLGGVALASCQISLSA